MDEAEGGSSFELKAEINGHRGRAIVRLCAGGKIGDFRSSHSAALKGKTGGLDPEGYGYIHNDDRRVDQALREQEISEPAETEGKDVEPSGPSTSTEEPKDVFKKAPVIRHLRDKLRQFEISRFKEGNDKEHTRFGYHHIRFKVFFRDEQPAVFDIVKPVKIGNTVTLVGTSGRFTLRGDITDSDTKSIGAFNLHDSSKKEDAYIYYRAYRGKKPKVRVDQSKPAIQGSAFDRQVSFLREKTFPWVHNFSVLRGTSSYVTDLVHTVSVTNNSGRDLPTISLIGESKETGDRDWDVEVNSSNEEGKAVTNARLVGNSDQSTQRVFAVTLKDPESQEENTVMVEIEEENPEPPPAVDPADEPMEYVSDNFKTGAPATSPTTPQTPGTPPSDKGAGTPEPAQPVNASEAFLVSDTSLPRTRKMLIDYERSRSVPGVRASIATYQRDKGKKNQLQKFFYYANSFRPIMEATGAAYDVSPAYAYVTVIESAYFTGGQYVIQRPRRKSGSLISSALGPFQLLEDTARAQGLRVTALWKNDRNRDDDDHDERNYFTTSACGAANYMMRLTNIFSSDTTLAILAYKEGEGGAAAAAYCTKTRNQSCINRINHGMSGAEYGRYLKIAKNYSYTYAELDHASMIPPRMRDYVRNKLAAYFIASDPRRYGFTAYKRSSLPKHKTVKPPYPIQDARCRGIVNSLSL